MADVILAEQLASNNYTVIGFPEEYRGQNFVPVVNGGLLEVIFNLLHTGIDGDATMYIYVADAGGLPTGEILDSSTISTTLIGLGTLPVSFPFSGACLLTEGVRYVAILNVTTGETRVRMAGPGPYLDGDLVLSQDSGSTWSKSTAFDLYFQVVGSGGGASGGGSQFGLFGGWGW